MKRHIFLTGEIQVGKSTAIRKFLDNTSVGADGFLTHILRERGSRELAVARFDTERGETDWRQAAVTSPLRSAALRDLFDSHGAAIVNASGGRQIVIMDELGALEEDSPAFKSAVVNKLDGQTPVLGVIKKAESAFLDSLCRRPDVELITVTPENRDDIPAVLAERYALDAGFCSCYNFHR
ncbi:MAG: nucleoside-triphosphatase [Oscillospiraceae bacterium]|nr:nucleoside-triphosphatase [Oscillospiraceae bacterium]